MKPAIEPVKRMRPLPRAHLLADAVDEADRAGDVGVDDVEDVVEVLVEERVAEAVACVGEERVDGGSLHGRDEAPDAFEPREVGLDGVDADAQAAELLRRLRDLRPVGGDEQVEAVLCALAREVVADSGRRAGDDGERTVGRGHGDAPSAARSPCAAMAVPRPATVQTGRR